MSENNNGLENVRIGLFGAVTTLMEQPLVPGIFMTPGTVAAAACSLDPFYGRLDLLVGPAAFSVL